MAVVYTYDALNRMLTTCKNGETVINTYNGEGLRTAKTTNSGTTYFVLSGLDILLEIDGSGNQKARNIYGFVLAERQTASESFVYLYNARGDVTALQDSNGIIVAAYYYDAFGNITSETGNVDNPYRCAGYFYDVETGCYYLNARFYDPKIGRFLQADSYKGNVYDPLSLNLYTYVQNSPLLYIDPTGFVMAYREWYETYGDHSGGLFTRMINTVDYLIYVLMDSMGLIGKSSWLDTYGYALLTELWKDSGVNGDFKCEKDDYELWRDWLRSLFSTDHNLPETSETEYEYDREKAVEYAHKWAESTNYDDYERFDKEDMNWAQRKFYETKDWIRHTSSYQGDCGENRLGTCCFLLQNC